LFANFTLMAKTHKNRIELAAAQDKGRINGRQLSLMLKRLIQAEHSHDEMI